MDRIPSSAQLPCLAIAEEEPSRSLLRAWTACLATGRVSLQVYESLRRSEEFPKEKLAHFDGEGTEELLYEMRNLGVSLRPATAEYIVDNDLDPYVSP